MTTSPESATPLLSIRDLGKSYGDHEVLGSISVDVMPNEFMCIVGPSGAGKTTLLQCMSALTTPTRGEVQLNGSTITEPPSEMAIVFQDYSRSLMPWLSVLGNTMLPLRSTVKDKHERREKAMVALEEVGLKDHAQKYPWQMSGGMQQRAAIARALAYSPSIVLMDEPFASVDAQTRAELEDLTLRVKQHLGITVLLVTHDVDEAVYLSDRVLVLGGRPTSVIDLITTGLGEDRDQITTKSTREFADLRARVYREIQEGHR